MALSSDERAWFDERFDRIFDAMERNRTAAENRLNEHSTKINAVSAVSVKAVSDHERQHHDPAKRIGVMASITAIASGFGGFIAWIMSKFGGEK